MTLLDRGNVVTAAKQQCSTVAVAATTSNTSTPNYLITDDASLFRLFDVDVMLLVM
jgi:hypothetical protein